MGRHREEGKSCPRSTASRGLFLLVFGSRSGRKSVVMSAWKESGTVEGGEIAWGDLTEENPFRDRHGIYPIRLQIAAQVAFVHKRRFGVLLRPTQLEAGVRVCSILR